MQLCPWVKCWEGSIPSAQEVDAEFFSWDPSQLDPSPELQLLTPLCVVAPQRPVASVCGRVFHTYLARCYFYSVLFCFLPFLCQMLHSFFLHQWCLDRAPDCHVQGSIASTEFTKKSATSIQDPLSILKPHLTSFVSHISPYY